MSTWNLTAYDRHAAPTTSEPAFFHDDLGMSRYVERTAADVALGNVLEVRFVFYDGSTAEFIRTERNVKPVLPEAHQQPFGHREEMQQ